MSEKPASNYSNRRKMALKDGSQEYKEKRQYLVKIAATLFKEKGFKATTLRDIAKQAGMDRATVYYYVGNKEEFFKEAIKGILDSNVEIIEKLLRRKSLNPTEKLYEAIRLLMTTYHESYPYMFVYIQDGMTKITNDPSPWAIEMKDQTRRMEKAFMKLFKEGVRKGYFRDDMPVTIALNALFGMLNWTYHWYKPDGKHNLEDVIDTFIKVFTEGYTSNK